MALLLKQGIPTGTTEDDQNPKEIQNDDPGFAVF
jgi:hypothetical protein